MNDHKKTVTVIVNAEPRQVTKDKLTYEEVLALAFNPVPPNAFFTVTYERAEGNKEGSLKAGESVNVKEGMIFHVTETGQS